MFFIHKTISILIGSFLAAIGVNIFLLPYSLLDGGSIGIGLILHYLTGIQVGLIVILISIPIFIFAWHYNRSFFYNSLHGMLFFSFMIDVLYPWHSISSNLNLDPLTSAVIGGILVGSGIGLMLRFKTSVGGTDLIGLLFANHANLNPGIVIFIMDFFIVITGSLIVPNGSLLLSCITVITVGITTSLISRKK